jgi:hypothetical protein
MLKRALQYLERGWSVIPLVAGTKRPAIEWEEFQLRHATEEEVNTWWSWWPKANVAVVTGAISRIIVLDIDGPEADESLKGKEMPPTPQSSTGKGAHIWFKHPGNGNIKNAVRFLPGLDLRADGGYVVAPPSIHPNGSPYLWAIPPEDTPLELPPEWLKQYLVGNEKKRSPGAVDLYTSDQSGEDWYEQALNGVAEGERNRTIVRLCGRWLGLGMSHREVWRMLQLWNRNNTPPTPDDELRRSCESIIKIDREKKQRQELTAGKVDIADIGMIDKDVVLQSLSQTLELHIKKIIKYKSEPPSYVLVTETGEVRLGDVNGLIKQDKLRSAIAAGNDRCLLKTFSSKAWMNIAEQLLRATEDREVSEEATDKGGLISWFELYLSDNKPCKEDDLEPSKPFWWNEGLYLKSVPFKAWLHHRLQERIGRKELATLLRSIGAEESFLFIDRKTVRAWKLPQTIAEQYK